MNDIHIVLPISEGQWLFGGVWAEQDGEND